MKNIMVDPPGGWRYGFPKLWNGEEQLNLFLARYGYPSHEIEFALSYLRMWPAEDDCERVA